MATAQASCPELTEEDFVYAMKEMNTYIDVIPEDLVDLYRLACKYADMRHAEDVSVRDVMTTGLISVAPQNTLADAARVFLTEHVRVLPVLDNDRHALGVLTEADLLSALGLPCRHSSCSLWHRLGRIFSNVQHINGLGTPVEQAMTRRPVTVSRADTLHRVMDTMQRKHIRSVLVVDADEHVCGIVTRTDIVRAMVMNEPSVCTAKAPLRPGAELQAPRHSPVNA